MRTHEIVIMLLSLVIAAPVTFWFAHALPKRVHLEWQARKRRAALLERTRWVVNQARNGGHWMEKGNTGRRIRLYPGGPCIQTWKETCRWVPSP